MFISEQQRPQKRGAKHSAGETANAALNEKIGLRFLFFFGSTPKLVP